MTEPRRPIFRASALRHYGERAERAILPEAVSPRLLRWLWVVLALLLTASLVPLVARTPLHASGRAVINEPAGTRSNHAEPEWVAFLPAQSLGWLRVGQRAVLHPAGGGEPLESSVLGFEDHVLSPQAAARLVPALGGATRDVGTGIVVRLAAPGGAGGQVDPGAVFVADVEVRRSRLLELLTGFVPGGRR